MIAIVIILCFVACQPTPENVAVVGKNQAEFEEAISNNELSEQESDTVQAAIDVPTQLILDEIESKNGKFKVSVKANVIVPQISNIPVYRVSPQEISQELATQMLNGIFSGADLTAPKTEKDLTKAEIEAEILRIKKGDTDLARKDRTAYDEMIAPEIRRLEELYKTAKETYIPTTVSSVFQKKVNTWDPNVKKQEKQLFLLTGDKIMGIEGSRTLSDKTVEKIVIEKNERNEGAVRFTSIRTGERYYGGASVTLTLDNLLKETLPKISQDKASELAQNFLKNIGLGDFELNMTGVALSGVYADTDFAHSPKCYAFFFTKKLDYPINCISNRVTAQGYTFPWQYELARVYVDDKGIASMDYTSPTEVKEKVSESVKILPFEDIMNKFNSQILLSAAKLENETPIEYQTFEVSETRLGLGRISESEDFSSCLYVPVWDFYGTWTTKYNDDPNKAVSQDLAYSHLTINAIDGSIIDRELGY